MDREGLDAHGRLTVAGSAHRLRHGLEKRRVRYKFLPSHLGLLRSAAFLLVAMRSHASRVSYPNFSVAFFTQPCLPLACLG